ncbi:glycoside hydrolase family 27 protein [Mycena sp. CBHHK59/15]|nr:glycoside hydrolase family 27 protein [Mycena sp. CBHHK59/15]
MMYKGHHPSAAARVGRLPVMGYNTWNAYHCEINETLILETAQLMKSLGLADVGYNYVNIDDCYSEKQRSAAGDIVADAQRFPNGMRWLTNQIHSLGLKAGIYSDAGWFTCALYPGSFQNEERCVPSTFSSISTNFLQNIILPEMPGCSAKNGASTSSNTTTALVIPNIFEYPTSGLIHEPLKKVPFDEIAKENIIGRYARMSNAIADLAKATGKPPLLLSLCEWGREQPWLWARRLGQSWRTTGDITPHWKSIASIIDQNSFYSWASDFYGHGDLDMLEVGNGDLTYEEAKSHFTVWSLMKSPLLIGTHLASASAETLEILMNTEIIAINQDPVVGTAITPFRWGINPNWTPNALFPAQYWSGESQNGTVFMLLNVLDEPVDMFFNLTESPWIRAGRQYSVRDLWSHTDNGTAVRNVSVAGVPPHGVVALLLRDAGDEPAGMEPRCAVGDWCMDKNGTFV